MSGPHSGCLAGRTPGCSPELYPSLLQLPPGVLGPSIAGWLSAPLTRRRPRMVPRRSKRLPRGGPKMAPRRP
eukprot:5277704-Pyramimonas_sp.AAC.1